MKWQAGAPYRLADLGAMQTIAFSHGLESGDERGVCSLTIGSRICAGAHLINANADFAGADFAAEPCGCEFWLN